MDKIFESRPGAQTPEEIEVLRKRLAKQEAASEFLDDKETPSFRPDYAKGELAEKVAEQVTGGAKIENPTDSHHFEAGMPLKVKYNSEKEARDAVEKLISSGESGAELQAKMQNAWEQVNDKDKAE